MLWHIRIQLTSLKYDIRSAHPWSFCSNGDTQKNVFVFSYLEITDTGRRANKDLTLAFATYRKIWTKSVTQCAYIDHDLWKFDPYRWRRGGGCNLPNEFCNGYRTTGLVTMNVCRAYGASFAQHFTEKFGPGHARSRNYDIIRGTIPDHWETVFSVV